jgi:glycosyltransferase involved in cell wall biosynthesis
MSEFSFAISLILPIMNNQPLLTFIVLSYNYEQYIDKTIRSILEQTIQDFEIVVVDDFSKDNSVRVVRDFNDPRIRILCNEKNIGGAASYNRAVSSARGKWLVNLDADDWIAPNKVARQLDAILANPSLDIIGTYVSVIDKDGLSHLKALELEAVINQTYNFDRLDTWVGANHLCRSSTMVRHAAHLRFGLDDTNMVRAPDYELWTRAFRAGCKFTVVPEILTFIRLQSGGVTHADPLGTLLEMTYAMLQNLIPVAEKRALYPSISRIFSWVCQHPSLNSLLPIERYRLIGILMQSSAVEGFANFKLALQNAEENPELAIVGRRYLGMVGAGVGPYEVISKLQKDIELLIEGSNYWRGQSDAWQLACHATITDRSEYVDKLHRDIEAYIEARDYWLSQSEVWENACHAATNQALKI